MSIFVSLTHPPEFSMYHIAHSILFPASCIKYDRVNLLTRVFFGGDSLQMTLEDGFERFARACGKPSILLCDRGLMDGSVYMPPEEWACLVSYSSSSVFTIPPTPLYIVHSCEGVAWRVHVQSAVYQRRRDIGVSF